MTTLPHKTPLITFTPGTPLVSHYTHIFNRIQSFNTATVTNLTSSVGF